jgi:hypothetical protein
MRNQSKKMKGETNMKTWKNKLSAIAMLGCGYLGVLIENDATALVFLAMLAVPRFFAKENWVY